ncbi:hypothetical protein K402DRAFT_455528 [Aulographum hederae CBS 113979]|uniref:Uncharacterized protein n=1 Tax=Aulographum hederae CBS 113979 TaxID=1176131 RepID=A0A6G1GVV9_9PEZI|nr:hypothetical protein K402DRAFT_455528 [Aulographum hederae CBS 113979]
MKRFFMALVVLLLAIVGETANAAAGGESAVSSSVFGGPHITSGNFTGNGTGCGPPTGSVSAMAFNSSVAVNVSASSTFTTSYSCGTAGCNGPFPTSIDTSYICGPGGCGSKSTTPYSCWSDGCDGPLPTSIYTSYVCGPGGCGSKSTTSYSCGTDDCNGPFPTSIDTSYVCGPGGCGSKSKRTLSWTYLGTPRLSPPPNSLAPAVRPDL